MNRWILGIAVVLIALGMMFLFVFLVIAGVSYPVSAPGEPSADLTQSTTVPDSLPEATDPAPSEADDTPELYGTQAIVYNVTTGQILFRMDNGERIYPASIIKLFTAYTALQYLDPDDVLTAGDELDFVGEDSSQAYIYYGQQLTVRMLIEAMILPSGNDAAYILAAAAGRQIAQDDALPAADAAELFVQTMNSRAAGLGLSGTRFVNPDGYPQDGYYSCLDDLLVIGQLALTQPIVMDYTTLSRDEVEYFSGEANNWHNSNLLVDPESRFYCPYATGLKTGSSDLSGNCLLSSFRVDGEDYIIGVFGCPRSMQRYVDTFRLLNEFVTEYDVDLTLQEEPEETSPVLPPENEE